MGKLIRIDIADIDLQKPLKRENTGVLLAEGDRVANRFGANVFRGISPVDLTEYTMKAYFIRPTLDTMTLDGVIDGNTVYIDLPDSCYASEGHYSLALKIIGDDITQTLRVIDGYIRLTETDNEIVPETEVVSLKELLQRIDEVEAAAERAEAAADRAEAAGGGGTGSGTPGQDGEDGFSPVAKVTQTSTGATISITDKSGTTTATITNGKDGQDGYTPVKGKDYFDGAAGKDGASGKDGVSPTITASKSGKVTTLTIKDASGTKTATINDGADGAAGKDGSNGADGTSVTVKSVSESSVDGGGNVVTFSDGKTLTVKNGSKGSTGDKGDTGATGQRGTSILKVTTAPSSYTTATGGFTPTYRIALSTVKSQSKATEVLVGDTLAYSYYQYPIGYVDASYVYVGARVSIRGGTGSAGTSVTVQSVSESTEDGGNNVVTFSDGKTVTVKNGSTGAKGAKGDPGEDYVLTEADKQEIAGIVPIVKVAEQPEFVDSVDDMTDTSKMYVLKSDGTFYSYKEEIVPGETTTTYPNLLVPGAAELNKRYSGSSQSTTVKNGYFVTDYIAVPDFASITPYNARLDWEVPFSTATDVKIAFFNASKSYIGMSYIAAANTSVASGKTTINLRTQSGGTAPTVSEVAYVRLQLAIDSSMAALVATDIANLTITFDAVFETESTETVTKQTWSSTGIAYNQPADYEDRVIALETTTANNSADINVIKQQIANIESGETATVIPEWWEDEVADTIAKIKALQVGRDCITFPFFSDNHQRNGYAGILIKRVMDECHIPYCFFGGDGIANGYFGDETDAAMREQDAAFDAATAAIPAWQFCRAIGNHEYYWKVSSSETHYYTSDQVYEVFMRENTLAQSKEFGGDTYYYVEDKASKTRFIVMDMNTLDDSAQITWLQNTALSFQESGWAVVLIGHQPVTEHYATVINGAAAARTVLKNYINGSSATKADVVGWFAGHIHRDRIFAGVAANPGYNGSTDTATDAANGDPIAETLPWKTVSIISDNVALGYGGVKHAIDNSDQSHAIDFVTINKATKTVNLTRLGFGSDRSYTY